MFQSRFYSLENMTSQEQMCSCYVIACNIAYLCRSISIEHVRVSHQLQHRLCDLHEDVMCLGSPKQEHACEMRHVSTSLDVS